MTISSVSISAASVAAVSAPAPAPAPDDTSDQTSSGPASSSPGGYTALADSSASNIVGTNLDITA